MIRKFWLSIASSSMEVKIYLLFLVISGLALGGFLSWFIYKLSEPPFAYTNVHVVGPQVLCPGQALEVHYEVSSTPAPLIIEVVENVWSVDAQATVVSERDPSWFLNLGGRVVARELHYIIPPLPPGQYEYRRGADSSTTRPTYIRIPFTVPAGCPSPVPDPKDPTGPPHRPPSSD